MQNVTEVLPYPRAYLMASDTRPRKVAAALRANARYMVEQAGRGHLGTSMSSMESILAIRSLMKPGDKFLSSKGHDAVAQYAVLAAFGLMDENRLRTFRKPGGLPGHPTVDVPGILANTGSLGMGLSKALGFSVGNHGIVYVLLGDGEMMEGQNYEAMLSIARAGAKVMAVVDCNGLSQDGPAPLRAHDIADIFSMCSWYASVEPHGNDFKAVRSRMEKVMRLSPPPWCVVAQTTKGKGIPEIEGAIESHFGVPGKVYPPHPLCAELGEAMGALMAKDERVELVGADTLRDLCCYELKDKYPERVFDFGIAEQNAVSFASARALVGKVPVFATYACFMRRAFEQIYNQTTEHTRVIYVGSMAGPLPPEGPGISHQSLDDANYMGGLMRVWEPVVGGVGAVLEDALSGKESCYIRLRHLP